MCLLVHSPGGSYIWGWARQKPAARSFIWASHRGPAAQVLGPSVAAFLGTLSGGEPEMEHLGLEPTPTWDAAVA